MIALSGLLAAAAAQSLYPTSEVLAEFRQVCVNQPTMAAIDSVARGRGWQGIDPSAEPRLSRAVTAGKDYLAKLNVSPEAASYSKTVSGRNLALVVFRAPVPFDGAPRQMTNCNIYDFDASAPLETSFVTKWAGREPTNTINQGGVQAMEWAPGLLPGLPSKARIGFVPNAPEFRSQPIQGLALISNIFEEEK